MHTLSIDIETYSEAPIADTGAQRYILDDSFELLLFAYSIDGGPVEVVDIAQGEAVPESILSALSDPNYIKSAYNASFEWNALNKWLDTILPVDQWRCTMVRGMYAGFTAGLAATGIALGLPQEKQKLATGKSLIQYFCVPCRQTKKNGGRTRNYPHHDPEKWELFKEYNRQDVVTEMEIAKRLEAFPVPYFVQKEWETDMKINARGVRVDMELVRGALDIGDTITDALTEEATRITGLSNPNSVPQLSSWLYSHAGIQVDNLQKGTVSGLLTQVTDPDAKRMLQIRQALGKTSTAKYDAIKACVCGDDRVRGLLQFYGAHTGRWAGRLVQVQNLPRTYITYLDIARAMVKARDIGGLGLMYGDSVNDTLSQLIRTAFIPSVGNKFIDVDFAQIEARVISWISKQQWRLDVFRKGEDIYCASASQMFNCKVEKHGENSHLRGKGKIAELALGFQGGTGSLINMGALDNGLTEEELPEIVSRWRESNPNIVRLWYDMEEAATHAIEDGGRYRVAGLFWIAKEYDSRYGKTAMTIELPSGRKLYYPEPRIGENRWGRKSIIFRGVDQTTRQWTEIETYGGRLAENVTQAVARDAIALKIEALEAAVYPIVFHVHDEVVIDIKPYAADDKMLNDVIDIMRQPIVWADGLPLDADGWVGEYFKKD